MKKIWIRVVSLTFMLALVLSLSVTALANSINLGVQIENGPDQITVTVDNSEGSNAILEEQQPMLTVACPFDNAYVTFADQTVESTLADGKITFPVTQGGVYTIQKTYANSVTVPASELDGFQTAWINGVEYPVQTEDGLSWIALPADVEADNMIVYTGHVGNPDDVHTQYPVSMKVWMLEKQSSGAYEVRRVEKLDDILQYSGSSIRVTGKKGIRMITSVPMSKKASLTGSGLEGYKLVEYGTVLARSGDLSGGKPLTLEQPYARSNYAYKRGVADPVFAYDGNLVQYTNVLVGFTMSQCADDIAMRSYMILEDANGNQTTLYGGIVYRSIGYIAYQNRDVFTPGSEAYNYVWEIIHHVYGDQYDAQYKG